MAAKRQPPKLSITSIDGPKIAVTASYNPKEISVEKSVPWAKSAKSNVDPPDLEFTSAEGRSMSFELLFDTFESKRSVHTDFVANLMKLTLVDAAMKRPPKVAVKWGSDRLLDFQGVIESVSTKYTMFLPDGTPVRAICHIRIRESNDVSFKGESV
jgi:hypothetical protein